MEGYLERQVEANAGRIAFARSGGEARELLSRGRIAAVRTIENARFFALDPAYVESIRAQLPLMSARRTDMYTLRRV